MREAFPGGYNGHRKMPWRSRTFLFERHVYMVSLSRSMPPLTLMQIAIKVREKYGSENGRPLDHSTVLHHLKGRCRCE